MSEALQKWLQHLDERRRPPAEDITILEEAAKMEGPVRVAADAGCDLPPEIVRAQGLTIIPLIVRFGTQQFLDSELSKDAFWAYAADTLPQTSQPSMGLFEEAYAPLVDAGANVLCITITSRHSGTYNTAWAATHRFPGRVLVWDSLSISVGIGLQVLEAAKLAAQNLPMWQIVRHLSEIRRNTHMTLSLDTIEFLRHGGRVGGVIQALEGLVRFFDIKPLLRVCEGELRLLGAERSFRRALARLRKEALALKPLSLLGVAHTRQLSSAVDLAEQVAQEAGLSPEQILINEAGPALASHAGPGAVGIVAVQAAGASA